MSVKLNVFEGPLDLLLFLIRKNEIDIYDIPIAEVTRQYMDVLRSMKNMSLDVAGEFFVMAATLMYIKAECFCRRTKGLSNQRRTTAIPSLTRAGSLSSSFWNIRR